jgi:HJR/Mrr/RecB family endonuclease
MTLLSIGNSAIRPAGASYRDDLANGVVRKTGSKPIDDFLSNTFGYLVFQCQIIEFLHEYCGFTMGEADIVRRGFAKKTGTDKYIPIIKNGGNMPNSEHHIEGFIKTMKDKYGIDERLERIGRQCCYVTDVTVMELRFGAYKSEKKEETEPATEELTPTEQLEAAMKKIDDDLAADILQKARDMSPAKFEQLVLDLLLAMGYGGSNKDLAKVTPVSHDNGVDGIIPEDALGLDKIYIQAKRYKEGAPVHKPEIQQFIGALSEQKASKGVFVTTSTFTQGARESVSKATSKIVLIDGIALAKYMIEFNVGVSTRKTYEVKRIDTDYFEE